MTTAPDKKKSLSSLLLKLLLLVLPLLILTVFYIVTDPFKVISKKIEFEDYYDRQPYELNREFISTELLLKNYKKYNYNSFIMGSCESYVYRADVWKNYTQAELHEIFHFPAASETLYGVYLKIKFLDQLQIPIKNCLLIMDNTTFKGVEPRYDYIHANHPVLTGEHELSFQLDMFKSFFSNFFCIQYLCYKLTGKVNGFMKNNFAIEKGQIRTTILNNEYFYEKYDRALQKDSIGFYKANTKSFYKRDTLQKRILSQPILKQKQVYLLNEINKIFVKHHTNFKIVLSPMYDQVYFNEEDINRLKQIFGANNINDYSGINRFTKNIYYFYDNFHYKSNAANEIMEEIYTNPRKP